MSSLLWIYCRHHFRFSFCLPYSASPHPFGSACSIRTQHEWRKLLLTISHRWLNSAAASWRALLVFVFYIDTPKFWKVLPYFTLIFSRHNATYLQISYLSCKPQYFSFTLFCFQVHVFISQDPVHINLPAANVMLRFCTASPTHRNQHICM